MEGIKPKPNKVKGIMNLGRPTPTTEARDFIRMVQHYRDMWPRWSQVLSFMKEASISPNGRSILWNNDL